MKYFVYISDTKVNMLYEQIPASTRNNIATELKIDLKFLSATFKEDAAEKSRTQMSKLQAVTKYIDEHEEVGTVDEPRSYFRGDIPLKWVIASGGSKGVLFTGVIEKTILILGGSAHHVIGGEISKHTDTNLPNLPFSNTYWLMVTLGRIEMSDDEDYEIERGWSPWGNLKQIPLHGLNSLEAPIQRLEFLAKRLLIKNYSRAIRERDTYGDHRFLEESERLPDEAVVLYGTPIYIALAE